MKNSFHQGALTGGNTERGLAVAISKAIGPLGSIGIGFRSTGYRKIGTG